MVNRDVFEGAVRVLLIVERAYNSIFLIPRLSALLAEGVPALKVHRLPVS